jgi:hypothetical protein
MQHFPINWLALLVAAAARFLFGWLWYSPFLFGKSRMALTNCTPEEMMPVLAPTDLICSRRGGPGRAAVGFFNWLGFVATVMLTVTLYEKRPAKLFWIDSGFQLISLLIMGAIVAVWV